MRIRKLAKSFNNTASDAEQPTQKRIKTAAMGGSYLDSACRTVCTFIALTAFSFFAFYHAEEYRKENGLTTCYTLQTVEAPVQESLSEGDEDAFNVSKHWQYLFYAHIGAGVYTIIQIIVATCAYQTKKRRTCCDLLVLPITVIHLPIQLGAFIWCHVARFTHSGRVCSGDFLSDEQFKAVKEYQVDQKLPGPDSEITIDDSKQYLILEGEFIKWWIILWWLIFGVLACCFTCCYCCLIKGKKPIVKSASTRE